MSEKGGFTTRRLRGRRPAWSTGSRTRSRTIVDGIEQGSFPAHPVEPFGPCVVCPWCDPDGLGVAELRRGWERKRHDPAAARPTPPWPNPRRCRHDLADRRRAGRRSVARSARPARRATASSTALDETLFVEAGAGSGKTRALVDRIVQPRHDRHRGLGDHRRHHLHREGGRRAARPGAPPPRRRARAAATSATPAGRSTRRPRRPGAERVAARSRHWTTSTAPPSAPCTASPSGC